MGYPVEEPLNVLGQTILMLIVLELNIEGIESVLEWGANLNSVDYTGRTALHYLVQIDIIGDITSYIL